MVLIARFTMQHELLNCGSRTDGLSFSEELNRLAPNLPTTGEVKVPCHEENKLKTVEAIMHAFGDYESSTIDGIRIQFNNDEGEQIGWYLARKSNTEPILVMRVEATSEQGLSDLLALIHQRISPIIDISKLLE